ncbi:uncharacterized protein cnk [Bemisia tabaci]|uniref:uncharacterized protein cnk n=1 Tax=Bemisia tabaci TaxID=7038 RepID=UPI003B27D404
MAYVNVAEWKPDQVTDWLKGLDDVLLPYLHSFLKNEINGQYLLNIQHDELEKLGIFKLGHQEIILEAVEQLRNFHYDLDRENLQLLALRLSCAAHSLHNELNRTQPNSTLLSTQTLADVANIVTTIKPLVCWLDRPPFSGQVAYINRKSELLKLSLEMATSGQRDRFADNLTENIRSSCQKLAVIADQIIQDIHDPLILQPASLDLVTVKKRPGDHLGFYIVPSFHGIHQIGELKCNSAAHQCGKIECGDEIVQINYQTVVGWQVKQVMVLFEESSSDVFLTLKKRPRHTKVFGQIYMKPYRLPSKKHSVSYTSRWHDSLPSPRPELLSIPHFTLPLPTYNETEQTLSDEGKDESTSSSDEDIGHASPTSMRLYLPKPRVPAQRRATITGASPISKRPPVNLDELWHELKFVRQWRSTSEENKKFNSETLLRCSMDSSLPNRHPDVPPKCSSAQCLTSSGNYDSHYEKENKFIENTSPLERERASSNSRLPEDCKFASLKERIEMFSKADSNNPKPKIPPKTFKLNQINKFNNVENTNSSISKVKQRGKLDKSYSTPAYDLNAIDAGIDLNSKSEKEFHPPTAKLEKVDSSTTTVKVDNRHPVPAARTIKLENLNLAGERQAKVDNINTSKVKKFEKIDNRSDNETKVENVCPATTTNDKVDNINVLTIQGIEKVVNCNESKNLTEDSVSNINRLNSSISKDMPTSNINIMDPFNLLNSFQSDTSNNLERIKPPEAPPRTELSNNTTNINIQSATELLDNESQLLNSVNISSKCNTSDKNEENNILNNNFNNNVNFNAPSNIQSNNENHSNNLSQFVEMESAKSEHGQMVNTINNHLLKQDEEKSRNTLHTASDDIDMDRTKKINEILETISSSLTQHEHSSVVKEPVVAPSPSERYLTKPKVEDLYYYCSTLRDPAKQPNYLSNEDLVPLSTILNNPQRTERVDCSSPSRSNSPYERLVINQRSSEHNARSLLDLDSECYAKSSLERSPQHSPEIRTATPTSVRSSSSQGKSSVEDNAEVYVRHTLRNSPEIRGGRLEISQGYGGLRGCYDKPLLELETDIYGKNSLERRAHNSPEIRITTPTSVKSDFVDFDNVSLTSVASSPAPATFPRHRTDKKPLTPPPRPAKPVAETKGGCYRAMMVAKSMGKSASLKVTASPRLLRKKNPLLNKRRNISVKELGQCECQGWLSQRARGGAGAQWNKGWFVLKGTSFLGFNSNDSHKARIMIFLPGFTASVAEEVKSRKFAFKVYHAGTTFYFAADSSTDLAVWLDAITASTIANDIHTETVIYSETDGEEEESQSEQESCFPSPKMKKFSGLFSSDTPGKSSEFQKKFGSLKKLGSRNKAAQAEEGPSSESLDRKYLKFLGPNNVPTPTAQFRSYRRVPPSPPASTSQRRKDKSHHCSAESVLAHPDKSLSERCSSPVNMNLPPDMGDYRLASLARATRDTQQRRIDHENNTGFVTLEAFMLARQEEERRQQQEFSRPATSSTLLPLPPQIAPRTADLDNFSDDRYRCNRNAPSSSARPRYTPQPTREYRGGSPEKFWIDSLRRSDSRPQASAHSTNTVPDLRTKRLKKAANYQPPPVSPLDNASPGPSDMRFAFEMALDQSQSCRKNSKQSQSSSKTLKSFFSPSKSDHSSSPQKTLLGSPRLHRVLFREKKEREPPVPPPRPLHTLADWASRTNQRDHLAENDLSLDSPRGSGDSASLRLPLPPDYPGLEYPPVFEPETYSLSNATTVKRDKNTKDDSPQSN